MKIKLLVLLTFLAALSANAQENGKLISYYESTTAFVNNEPSNKKVLPQKIKLQTEKLEEINELSIDQIKEIITAVNSGRSAY